MSKRNSEGDVVANRMNLLLANSQRLLASWNGPKSESELEKAKLVEENEEEDFRDENLGYEQLGIGGKIPKEIQDGSFTRRTMTSNDKLLEQLLGKKAAKAHIAAKQAPKATTKTPGSGKPSRTAKPEESEDEEEGRTAAFKSKRRKVAPAARKIEGDDALVEEQEARDASDSIPAANEEDRMEVPVPDARKGKELGGNANVLDDEESRTRQSKPKAGSYLDEILAERSRKKKKKRRNKDKADV